MYQLRFQSNMMSIWRNPKPALECYNNMNSIRYLTNKAAWITRVKRKQYLRKYPTLVVEPNGAAYTIRHFEPRRIIKLPLDISTVSAELQAEILEKRKPKKKVVIEEEIDDTFDSKEYLKYFHKKQ